jgi:PAS domain S-box-containing protein
MSSFGDDRPATISVLHIDDDPDFTELAKQFLERDNERFEVVTETRARAGIDRLKSNGIDCIVSDYDMPEMDGLALLEAVRGPYPDMPFILFTGKGSEEIASEAISSGVTDYLQKGGGREQYEVLANRILNSVDRFRTEHELERSRQFVDRVLNLSPSAVVILDEEGEIIRANEQAERLLGLSELQMTDRTFNSADWEVVDKDGNPLPEDEFPFKQVRDGDEPVYNVETGIRRPDGETVWLSINAAPLWEGAETIQYVIAVLSDESKQMTHRQRQKASIRQLKGLGDVLSHDLGNILNIASGRLELARETGDDDHFEAVEESLYRAEEMLNELTTAIQAGSVVEEVTAVDVVTVFNEAWETQDTKEATKEVVTDIRILADKTALLRLFENLIRNAFEHGKTTATIRVGALSDGFYVEDDGVGIPESKREQVFEPGYTTKSGGTGVGLPSIQQIVLAHNWNVEITAGTDGGARFEITDVRLAAE